LNCGYRPGQQGYEPSDDRDHSERACSEKRFDASETEPTDESDRCDDGETS
jgi:hypothetical protein